MSMREYAVDSYGLVLTESEVKLYMTKPYVDYLRENGILVEDEDIENINVYDIREWLMDKCYCEFIDNDYTGDLYTIDSFDYLKGVDNDTYVLILECDKSKTLIGCSYQSINDVVTEMKNKVGEYLPDDFDYEHRIGEFIGTCWG